MSLVDLEKEAIIHATSSARVIRYHLRNGGSNTESSMGDCTWQFKVF